MLGLVAMLIQQGHVADMDGPTQGQILYRLEVQAAARFLGAARRSALTPVQLQLQHPQEEAVAVGLISSLLRRSLEQPVPME